MTSSKRLLLKISDLHLSLNNPRFTKPVQSEEEAILTFFKLKKVGPSKLENLLKDIYLNNTVFEDFIVLNENSRYTVYDGNRRLAVLKLFIDNNVEILKENYVSTYQLVEELKNKADKSLSKVYARVYTDKKLMLQHIELKHGGEKDGVGQIAWTPTEKEVFKLMNEHKVSSTIGSKIYKKIENDPNMKNLYEKINSAKGYTTTFTRFLSYTEIRRRIFHLNKGSHINLNIPSHYAKVCEMIEYFVDSGANVKNVYYHSDGIKFFENIEPIKIEDNSILQQIDMYELDEFSSLASDSDRNDHLVESNREVALGNTHQNNPNIALKFEKVQVTQFNDYDLYKLIKMPSKYDLTNFKKHISFYTNEQKFISNNIFSGDAPLGTYNIQVKFNDGLKESSRSVILEVIEPDIEIKVSFPKVNELFRAVPSFVQGDLKLNISNTVNELVKELKSIDNVKRYRLIVISSIRQLLELSISIVVFEKNLKECGNPKDNLEYIINHILTTKNVLNEICRGENKLKYQQIKNFLTSINCNALYSYWNLVAHDSNNAVYSDFIEKVNKEIIPLLIVFHNYLKLIED